MEEFAIFAVKFFCRAHLLTVFADKKDVKYVCQSCKVKFIDKGAEVEE
jgi:hypothetical protein